MNKTNSIPIQYVIGDATNPSGSGTKLIVHICNSIGVWGRGFVLALSHRWAAPEREYRKIPKAQLHLGSVQFVRVEEDTWVANLVGQEGIRKTYGLPPIRYEAIREGLSKVQSWAEEHGAKIVMPKIGAGLAGGSWLQIEQIIREELTNKGISTTVYEKT